MKILDLSLSARLDNFWQCTWQCNVEKRERDRPRNCIPILESQCFGSWDQPDIFLLCPLVDRMFRYSSTVFCRREILYLNHNALNAGVSQTFSLPVLPLMDIMSGYSCTVFCSWGKNWYLIHDAIKCQDNWTKLPIFFMQSTSRCFGTVQKVNFFFHAIWAVNILEESAGIPQLTSWQIGQRQVHFINDFFSARKSCCQEHSLEMTWIFSAAENNDENHSVTIFVIHHRG